MRRVQTDTQQEGYKLLTTGER